MHLNYTKIVSSLLTAILVMGLSIFAQPVSAEEGQWYLVSEDLTLTNLRDGSGGTLHYIYEYDEQDRLIQVTAGKRYERILTYDDQDNLLSDHSTNTKSDGSQSNMETVYTYDEQNRLLSTSTSVDGQLTSMEQRGYKEDSYSVLNEDKIFVYDYEDHLIEEYNAPGNGTPRLIAEYSYDEHGNVIRYDGVSGSYIDCTNTYDDAGNLIQSYRVTVYASGKEPVYDDVFDYTYDENGNLLTLENYHLIRQSGTQEMITYYNYKYDSENRMTYSKTAENNAVTESWFEYDEYGNQIYRKIQTDMQVMEYQSVYELR